MAKLPYEDLQAMKELLNKAGAVAPASVPSTRLDYDTNELEDIGYEAPTQDQINSPGFQAASKYLKNSQPIVGTKAAELLGAYRDQENSRMPASEEPELTLDETPNPEMQTSPSRQDTLSLLDKYKSLLAQRDARNFALDIGSAANRLGSAIAGKGATGGDFLQGLKKQSEQPIQDLLAQGKVVETDNELQMSDPNSDISKFARERAVASATKMGIPAETISKLQSMSAKQLEKLGLFSKTAQANRGVRSERITGPDGVTRTVLIDNNTGETIRELGQSGFSSQFRTDPETGNIIGLSPSNPNKAPIGVTGGKAGPKEKTITSPNGETKEVDYSTPTALNKINPKLYTDFKKTQDEFNKDMKDSREVATSVTNLAAKLKPGQNMKIDSGLLGGIQTQAAKMAGQKGVLTDQDLVKFAGAGGVSATIDRFFSGNFDGEMSEQDVNFFKAFAKKMEGSLAEDIANRSKLYTGQILNESKEYLPGLTEADVQKWLNVDQVAPSVQKQNAPTSDKVKVILPDGRTGMIPKENLQKALEKGAKEVK